MFTPFYTPLMDINVPIPKSCTYTVHFSKSFKAVKIQEVSAFVNEIYSKCLTADGEFSNQTKISEEQIEVKLAISSSIASSIPSSCEYAFDFTEENFLIRLDDASSFVSEVFSKFPCLTQEEKKKLGKSNLDFNLNQQKVTAEEVGEFKKALKERIVKDLTKQENWSSVTLSTDYWPEEQLKEVAQSVFKGNIQLGFLFPYKTDTRVRVLQNEISVRMRFNTW